MSMAFTVTDSTGLPAVPHSPQLAEGPVEAGSGQQQSAMAPSINRGVHSRVKRDGTAELIVTPRVVRH